MTGYAEHAANLAQAQAEINAGNAAPNPNVNQRLQGPVLVFQQLGIRVGVFCSHVVQDFELEYGKVAKTMVEKCEFPASDIPANVPNTVPPQPVQLIKGTRCTLQQFPGDPGIAMQLWAGGPLLGGQVYRFMLVDANYNG